MENSTSETRWRIASFARSHGPALITLLVFVFGAFAIYKALHGVTVHDVIGQLRQITTKSVALAGLATAFGYAALIGYDWSAIRFIGKSVPLRTIAIGSFTAYALSNSVGLAVVSGGAVRYRFYRGLGLNLTDIAIVSTYCALAFGVGVTVVGFAALAYHPAALSSVITIPPHLVRLVSVIILVAACGFLAWGAMSKHKIGIGKYKIVMPGLRQAVLQILFSLLDILFAAVTLYILLPNAASSAIPFSTFVAVFAGAAVAAVLSHVPGGIGVFEAVILGAFAALPDQTAGIAASLLAYRIVYYFLPLLAGISILIGVEFRERVGKLRGIPIPRGTALGAVSTLVPLIPTLAAALTFLTGATLVLNGIVPIPKDIIEELQPVVSLSVFELSNVVMGIAGGALLVLANGLRKRIRGALWLTIGMIVMAMMSLVLQHLDFDLVVFMALLALALWFSRFCFYRQSRLSAGILSVEWLTVFGGFVLLLVLFFLFAHQDAEYKHDLWWQFAFDANMPRALRIGGVALAVSILSLLLFALRPPANRSGSNAAPSSEWLRTIIAGQDNPDANFALTGDKEFLVSEQNDGFIMFGRHGRSFVALGPPVGNAEAASDLIDRFISVADDANCRPAFYQIAADDLALFVDAGFMPSKLGEEAIVSLSDFGLEGPERRKLRQAYNRAQRDGLSLETLAPPHSAQLLGELKRISDEWLSSKHAREKGFSLGRFDEAYLQNFRLAIVREGDAIVAFANIFETETKNEVTIDLMRHSAGSPPSTMDFLFVALLLELKAEGFQRFSLGMAPLTGLKKTRHPRIWDRVAGSISRFGGHFYNFEGLRDYKDKFQPEWKPRYLMTWGGVDPLLVANDINALVSGGVRGAIRRDRAPT